MEQLTCGFIGLGLIGGSIAKAIRRFLPDTRIYAYDINEKALSLSLEEGVSDCTFSVISDKFSECDIIFLCAPVSHNAANLAAIKPLLKAGAILTDVGSVKTDIHVHIHAQGLDRFFIGGHPMAGSERFGYPNAKEGLLENAYYILTPTAESPAGNLKRFQSLVRTIGAIPLVLDYRTHDFVTAGVSHLPHVIASSLVNLVHDSDSEDGIMKMIAAGGFKDITRIASSSPEMWQQICLTNADNIVSLLDRYITSLQTVRQNLCTQNGTALYDFFDRGRKYRDSFLEASSGPIKKSYAVYVDIPDEPGALASIATILAFHQISIKNIGIIHNREFEQGVLRIEFWEESAIEKAVSLLTLRGYNPIGDR
ncbi:MAG: prephenate dehydrogenase [Clostridiales bacterium]|nr:prephenate dehydrogenase [Clostridiales bacterium]